MEITRNQLTYTLTPGELKEAAGEWEHLCLMHRIIGYLAEYHNIPLAQDLPSEEYRAKLLEFYDTYHIPFEALVKAYESPIEELADVADQVYLFLSSLAQTYEIDGAGMGVNERKAFLILFQDKKAQQLDREMSAQCVQLGFFTQVSSSLLICDPSTNPADLDLVRLPDVEPGMWRAAVQVVKKEEDGDLDQYAPSFLMVKADSCPFSFQQILEQSLLWPHLMNVFTDTGIMGVFDEKYYRDPTPFGIPPISGADERWTKACSNLILEYPNACVFPHGAISGAGEGEGLYDAYFLKNSAGRVIAIAIDFLLYGED